MQYESTVRSPFSFVFDNVRPPRCGPRSFCVWSWRNTWLGFAIGW